MADITECVTLLNLEYRNFPMPVLVAKNQENGETSVNRMSPHCEIVLVGVLLYQNFGSFSIYLYEIKTWRYLGGDFFYVVV